MRVESTRMFVVRKKTKTTTNKQKTKHIAVACRSKAYVYFDEFKVIF
jgi:hypothetical protein